MNYIFEKIGTKSRKCVEIGIENGTECNSRYFIQEKGWSAVLIEVNKTEVRDAKEFYKRYPVVVVSALVTPTNIKNFIDNDVDLLSIDVDGNDYWLWTAVKKKPRVVIIEYNSTFGNKSLTIPYSDNMRIERYPDILYHGAGLNALIKLGKRKGYKLIYCESHGINAIFLRKDIKHFPEVRFEEAFRENMGRRIWGSTGEQFRQISNRKFVTIE